MELTLDQALQKGIEAHKAGRVQEADRYYTAILKANSKHPDANHNMGVLAVGIGKTAEAIPFFETALNSNPKVTQYWLSLVEALIKNGELGRAECRIVQARKEGVKSLKLEELYKRTDARYTDDIRKELNDPSQKQLACLIKLFNAGNLIDMLEEASNLVLQFPKSATVYNMLGAAHAGLGQYDDALKNYKIATSLDSSFVEPHSNIGAIYNKMGKTALAISYFRKALELKPDYREARYNMAHALRGVVFKQRGPELFPILASILDSKTFIRPRDICKGIVSLLKLEPTLSEYLIEPNKTLQANTLEKILDDLMRYPLLQKLMSLCPITDLELETLLSHLRFRILKSISDINPSENILGFQSALALQCYTNEYVYSVSAFERRRLNILEKDVATKIKNNDQPLPQEVLILAAYKPLHEYEWIEFLSVNSAFEVVHSRQCAEPELEESLKMDIPALAEVKNNISMKVRKQYEESPYPRWINTSLSIQPGSISSVVNSFNIKLFNKTITNVENPDILIAGCGTGQHPLGTATRFKNSKVIAVDLSLSSLAYAKRKTLELGIKNIEYMQADILDLGLLEQKFHIIESCGVLHHMDNPMEGWKTLVGCLREGGLMRIALYSELARGDILKIRSEMNLTENVYTPDQIVSFRSKIVTSEADTLKKIKSTSDFYSLSELRDLLFHVQEHRYTVLEIEECLAELGLGFCGFEDVKIVKDFISKCKSSSDPYDLKNWEKYEDDFPDTFRGMYHFWCQKI